MNKFVYLIAVVPPPKIREEVTQIKVLIAERFNSKHALKLPPHVTLHMPFKWKESKLPQLEVAIRKINTDLEGFFVELNGFDFFERKHVIYVDVVNNKELSELQGRVVDVCRKDLKLDNANYKGMPFHPHMTVAFRDLRKPQFLEAKKYFEKRKYRSTFKIEKATLLKYNGEGWYNIEN